MSTTPVAGPILGIIFTAAAIQGASLNTSLLLLAYALGAATSLATSRARATASPTSAWRRSATSASRP